MILRKIVDILNLQVVSAVAALDKEILGGYAGDLLSDVMANAKRGDIWVTIQIHENIVAVAVLKEISAILITNDRKVGTLTIEKSERESIPILVTPMSSFEVIGELNRLGIPGRRLG
ncbi:MAG: serine kinase [Candidatus Tectomicrobia bacterium]|uniref:Serine kinase n=1 Tax=Tectimicrobiota bacterium TaxID=2528274 RepID=A0A933GNH6_UNCTE|nr:serine kinase [Candidatus Tectomicrobia bacterium]